MAHIYTKAIFTSTGLCYVTHFPSYEANDHLKVACAGVDRLTNGMEELGARLVREYIIVFFVSYLCSHYL